MQTNPNMHSIFWKLWRGCSPFAHSWLRPCVWLNVISIFTEIPLWFVPSNLMEFHSHSVSFNIITIFQAIDLVWIMSFTNKIYIRSIYPVLFITLVTIFNFKKIIKYCDELFSFKEVFMNSKFSSFALIFFVRFRP
jgi:hypothetical protein